MRIFDIGAKVCAQLAYSPDSATLAASYFPKYATRVVREWTLDGTEEVRETVFSPASYRFLFTHAELLSGKSAALPKFRVPRRTNHTSMRVGECRAQTAPVCAVLVRYGTYGNHWSDPYTLSAFVVEEGSTKARSRIDWDLPQAGAGTWRVVLSADGRRVAVSAGPLIRVWQVDTGEELATIRIRKLLPGGFAFSADGRYLGVLYQDSVSLYDTTSWTEAKSYSWKVGKLRTLAFSPDGATAAVGSDRGKVVVFDLE